MGGGSFFEDSPWNPVSVTNMLGAKVKTGIPPNLPTLTMNMLSDNTNIFITPIYSSPPWSSTKLTFRSFRVAGKAVFTIAKPIKITRLAILIPASAHHCLCFSEIIILITGINYGWLKSYLIRERKKARCMGRREFIALAHRFNSSSDLLHGSCNVLAGIAAH